MVTKRDRWRGGDGLGIWNRHVHAEVYRMIGQRGPAVWHRGTLLNNLWSPMWEKNLKEDRCVYLCNWTTLLHGRNDHHVAYQLYFKLKKKTIQKLKKKFCCDVVNCQWKSILQVSIGELPRRRQDRSDPGRESLSPQQIQSVKAGCAVGIRQNQTGRLNPRMTAEVSPKWHSVHRVENIMERAIKHYEGLPCST